MPAVTARLVLVGLGLHAKRFHVPFLRKHALYPILIVDLESNRDAIAAYLKANQITANVLLLPDKFCNATSLPPGFAKKLATECQRKDINRVIVATEPKAHRAYAEFFIRLGIDVLIDKPLTTPIGVTHSLRSAIQIFNDYTYLNNLANTPGNGQLTILAQRRFHRVYSFARQVVDETIRQYGIPITFLDMYSADGLWTMPPEFESRENHPHKYGYGTLMHAGYHFVDMVAWFMELNDQLDAKRPDRVEVISRMSDPKDFQFVVAATDYERFFRKRLLPGILCQSFSAVALVW